VIRLLLGAIDVQVIYVENWPEELKDKLGR